MNFQNIDWLVLGLFMLALVGIVVWVAMQKEEDTEDYFLAGRIDFRLQYRLGTPGGVGLCRRAVRPGDGALGVSVVDYPDAGLDIRSFLLAHADIYHARVS